MCMLLPVFTTVFALVLIYPAFCLLTTHFLRLRKCLALVAIVLLLIPPPVPVIGLELGLRVFRGAAILKTLDLVFFRDPPRMVGLQQFDSFRDRLRYASRLYTEMRYLSFDISTYKPPRKAIPFIQVIFLIVTPFILSPLTNHRNWFLSRPIVIIGLEVPRLLFSPTSPPIFSSFTDISSCSELWNHAWHQLFRSPCISIGMRPLFRFGHFPALCGGFLVMGVYHGFFMSSLVGPISYFIWITYFLSQAFYITFEGMYLSPGKLRKCLFWVWDIISGCTLVLVHDHCMRSYQGW